MGNSVTDGPDHRRPGGRPRLYPLDRIEVGGTIIIPYAVDARGVRLASQQRIYAAVRQEARRYGKKFEAIATHAGVQVRRIS